MAFFRPNRACSQQERTLIGEPNKDSGATGPDRKGPTASPKSAYSGLDVWTAGPYSVIWGLYPLGGQSVTVTTNAEIDGDPQVGDTVEVEGLLVGPDLTPQLVFTG